MINLLPPTYFFIYLMAAILLHLIFPIKTIVQAPYSYSGAIFIILGAILNIWADSMFKKRKTTVKPFEKPTVLIIDGSFRFTRHPIYLGFVSILFGLALLLGTVTSFFAPILMFITLEKKFIPQEEKNLEEVFGKEYLDYKNRVKRWL
ncbi:isoprenylcysteine carboxylmethyltransferase family protein [Candidatus Beckwithbacteria bacterium]|nr:isoprenylcysteine carboxylmethyltransferase family protein [Candidatus Beckwithbacteria bacterium]